MVASLLGLSPDGSRPLLQGHWSARHVPLGMVATRPVYPSSLVVHTGSGWCGVCLWMAVRSACIREIELYQLIELVNFRMWNSKQKWPFKNVESKEL